MAAAGMLYPWGVELIEATTFQVRARYVISRVRSVEVSLLPDAKVAIERYFAG